MVKVFASRRFPERVRDELERSFELDLHDSLWPPTREELLARVAGKDGLMLMLTDLVNDELLDAAGPQREEGDVDGLRREEEPAEPRARAPRPERVSGSIVTGKPGRPRIPVGGTFVDSRTPPP